MLANRKVFGPSRLPSRLVARLSAYLSGAAFALALLVPAVAGAEPSMPQPVPLHQRLVGLVGHWSVTQSLWLDDANKAKIDKGTAQFDMVLNNHHLRQVLRIDDGTSFEGLGYLGYDAGHAQAFSTWMDVNFDGLVVAYGQYDEAAKSLVLQGRLPGATPRAPLVPLREVLTFTDDDHFTYAYYETRSGHEALTVRLDYSRVP